MGKRQNKKSGWSVGKIDERCMHSEVQIKCLLSGELNRYLDVG